MVWNSQSVSITNYKGDDSSGALNTTEIPRKQCELAAKTMTSKYAKKTNGTSRNSNTGQNENSDHSCSSTISRIAVSSSSNSRIEKVVSGPIDHRNDVIAS